MRRAHPVARPDLAQLGHVRRRTSSPRRVRAARREAAGLRAGRSGRAAGPGSRSAAPRGRRCPRAAAARRAAPRCRGAPGRSKSSSVDACSTTWPAYITTMSSAASATTPMSCVMRIIAMSCSLAQVVEQVEHLRLHGHVERGRRLVGDQELRVARERDRDHHALAHAARVAVRVVVEPLGGVRDPHLLEQLDRALAAPAPSSRRGGAGSSR